MSDSDDEEQRAATMQRLQEPDDLDEYGFYDDEPLPENACEACLGDGWRLGEKDGKTQSVTCMVCNGSGKKEEPEKKEEPSS